MTHNDSSAPVLPTHEEIHARWEELPNAKVVYQVQPRETGWVKVLDEKAGLYVIANAPLTPRFGYRDVVTLRVEANNDVHVVEYGTPRDIVTLRIEAKNDLHVVDQVVRRAFAYRALVRYPAKDNAEARTRFARLAAAADALGFSVEGYVPGVAATEYNNVEVFTAWADAMRAEMGVTVEVTARPEPDVA